MFLLQLQFSELLTRIRWWHRHIGSADAWSQVASACRWRAVRRSDRAEDNSRRERDGSGHVRAPSHHGYQGTRRQAQHVRSRGRPWRVTAAARCVPVPYGSRHLLPWMRGRCAPAPAPAILGAPCMSAEVWMASRLQQLISQRHALAHRKLCMHLGGRTGAAPRPESKGIHKEQRSP